MAALFLYLYIWLSFKSVCVALFNSQIDETGGHMSVISDAASGSAQAGVAMFERYEDTDVYIFANGRQIPDTVTEVGHLPDITLQFTAFGRKMIIDLHLNRDLFSASYVKKLHHRGKKFMKILQRGEHCYYQGSIRNSPNSHAAISTCNGLRGYVSDGEEMYHIDPLNGTLHRVYRNSDRKKLPFQCGTDHHDIYQPPNGVFQDHTRKKRSIRGPYDKNQYTRFVELYLVNDYRTFERYKKNAEEVFRRSQEIANIVNSLYRQLNIYVVLVGVEVWGTGDKIGITINADTTLENFLRYRKERINPYHPNDNAQLITGIHFDHGVVGKAIKGPICTHQFSGGICMDYDGPVTLVATTVAHEIGHNFGMEHDNDTKCSCPDEKCIMADTSGQQSPQHWSSCSQNTLHEAFELGMDYCLRNQPRILFDGPVCGNGFVEDGEECDCGLPEDCTNRCCNATSCQLHSQAVCATGRCCNLETCKPRAPSSLCREPVGECDLPEFCDGVSEFCPQDIFMENGLPCKDGQSYCYKGKCNTHGDQCQLLWGSTGRVSDPICFQQLNVRGDHDGNCGYNWTTDRYYTCDRENVMCGLLHCVHLNEKLMFWRDNLALDMRANFLTRGNTQYVCRSAMLDVGLDMPDPGLVPDGAKCEENKICINQACVPLQKLDIPQCTDCHGNGVCNSKGHCHCHVGYAPPLCDRPGFGGSIDSGPATNEYAKKDLLIGLLVLFLVILPLIVLLILAYINRRRLVSWWKLGPKFKFGILKKSQMPAHTPQPRSSASFSEKWWSAAPPKPSPVLEISSPFRGDQLPPIHRPAPAPPPTKPAPFKPPASKPGVSAPRLNPPAVQNLTPSTTSASGSIASKDRRSFLGGGASSTTGSVAPSDTDRKGDNFAAASNIGGVDNPRMLPSLSLSLDRRLKMQKVPIEEVNTGEEKVPFVPLSPTKSGRKVTHSNSLKETRPKDKAGGPGEKLLKRESFRGTEISNPILVSTTNRDSQVFADFEFDESGIVARPPAALASSSPSADNVRDGCRSPVRRSQSDRPLSPKRRTQGVDGSSGSKKGPEVRQNIQFRPRPLPPEPVLETEPLYINEGLSDLSDLKDCISSAFRGMDDTLRKEVVAVDPPKAPPVPSALPGSSGQSSRAKENPVLLGAKVDPPVPVSSSIKREALATAAGDKLATSSKEPAGNAGSIAATFNALRRGPSAAAGDAFTESKPEDTTARKPVGKGPLLSSLNKGPSSVTNSTKKEPLTSGTQKVPGVNAANRTATIGTSSSVANSTAGNNAAADGVQKMPVPSTAAKGLTNNPASKGLTNTASKSSANSELTTTKMPTVSVVSKSGGASGSSKQPAPASRAPNAAGSIATIGSGKGGSSSSHVQRSTSAASGSRPVVAPKPQPSKNVRSFNF